MNWLRADQFTTPDGFDTPLPDDVVAFRGA